MLASDVMTKPHRAQDTLADSTVWEGSVGWTEECAPYTEGVLPRYQRAGFTHVSLTVAAEWNGPEQTLRYIGQVRERLLEHSDSYLLVDTVEDIIAAKKARKLAVSFNFQGGGPFGNDPSMVGTFARLGVKQTILSYNRQNDFGTGCQESDDAGLSPLGRSFVEEMNRAGMMIDLSHVGHRTALDTVEHSVDPVVFSHSNSAAMYAHVRNIADDLIRACADRGGVIGLNSLSFMLASTGRSNFEDYVSHIAYVADLVGTQHVALGMDWNFYDPFMQKMFAANPAMAQLGYPPPPWDSLAPETLPEILEALLRRGWSDDALRGLLGENMLRVARTVWGT